LIKPIAAARAASIGRAVSSRSWACAQPIWRADGRELFYVAPDNTIMSVDVREDKTTVEFGTPRPLFQARIAIVPARQPSWMWDVAPDGQRFLFILDKDDNAPVTLVTNWRSVMGK